MGKGSRHNLLRFGHHLSQVLLPEEALGVNLVNIFRTRRARGEPTILSNHLQPADRRIVPRGAGQLGADRFAGQSGGRDGLGSELFQASLLGRGRLAARLGPGIGRGTPPKYEQQPNDGG